MKIGNHFSHPAADAFPLMDEESLNGLADDIEANGLRRKIVLHNDLILDGRNRYLACIKLGIEPQFKTYEGPIEPDDLARYVCSENLARRDLTPGARALCARRLVALIRVRKAREKFQKTLPGVETHHAADVVLGDGTPELIEAVERGDVELHEAVEIAKHEPEQQRAVIEKINFPNRETKPPEPARSQSIELSENDLCALRALCSAGEASKHGIVRAGAGLLKRMVGL